MEEKKEKPKINYQAFNHNGTFFAVGTDQGFQIYKTDPIEQRVNFSKYNSLFLSQ